MINMDLKEQLRITKNKREIDQYFRVGVPKYIFV